MKQDKKLRGIPINPRTIEPVKADGRGIVNGSEHEGSHMFDISRVHSNHILLCAGLSLLVSACATPGPTAPTVSAVQLIQSGNLTSLVCNARYATGLAPVYVRFHVNRKLVFINQEYDNPAWGVDPASTYKVAYFFVDKGNRVAWNMPDARTQRTELVGFFPRTLRLWFSEHHQHLLLRNGTWRAGRHGTHTVTPNVYGPGWTSARYDCDRD